MTRTVIIAGQGALPALVVAGLQARGDSVILAEMEGFPSDVTALEPVRFRIERLVPFLDHLAAAGVTQVVMAGAVRRPQIEPELFDARTATLVPRLLAAMQGGDDAALRAIIGILEEWDLAVIGAHEVLPGLLPGAGTLTDAAPGPAHAVLATTGERMVDAMGRDDSGQACIVGLSGTVLREGPEGTDAMIAATIPAEAGAASAGRPDDADGTGTGRPAAEAVAAARQRLGIPPLPAIGGGILFKAPKPGQDRRADLPVIGPQTARLAARAGLAGIVIEAGGVMVIDRPEVIATLNRAGLFLWVRPRGAGL